MGTMLDEQFWLSNKVHELGPIGIAVWSCIIQGKHAAAINLPGLYSISVEDVFWQLGGDLMGPELKREVENAFWLIVGKGMAVFDPTMRQVRLPNVWKYAATPNTNQISGWKSAFLKAPKTSFRYEHLPTLRKLADRCTNGVQMFDARFGQIVPGKTETFHLGNNWRPGEELPPGTKAWLDPTDQDLSEKNIDHLFLSRREEPRSGSLTLNETLTLTLNGGSRRVSKGFEKGSLEPDSDNEVTGKGEGFSKGFERVREGFGNPCETVLEGVENGSVSVGEDNDDDRRPDPRSASRQSGPAPRREPASRSPDDDRLPVGVGGQDVPEGAGGGGWADVVELPVPDGRRGNRKRE